MNPSPQLRLLKRRVIKVSDDSQPLYRYAMVTEESEDSISGYYLEQNRPTFFFTKPNSKGRIGVYSDNLLTRKELQILTTLEQELNIWYQYTDESPFDNVTIEGPNIVVETVESITTYPTKHIARVERPINALKTVLTLTNSDRVELMIPDETHKALIAAISGQTKPLVLNI